MNNAVTDRIEGDLEKWLKREQRFQKIFPGPLADNRTFLKEKLTYYGGLNSLYRNRANQEERTTLRLVRENRKSIERQLYPNAVMRLAYRIYSSIRKKIAVQKEQKRNKTNLYELKASVERLGFPENALFEGHTRALPKHLRENTSFAYQISKNEQMSFRWDLSEECGYYRLHGYRATLTKEGEPERTQKFPLIGTDGITASQAYNLLSGRSVQTGKEGNRHWIKLDLNDKDLYGDHKVKRFYPDYRYSLRGELDKLPLKSLGNTGQDKMLEGALRNGDQKKILLSNGKRLTVEANPQHKTLNFYQNGQKISLRQALKGRREQIDKRRIKGKLDKELKGTDRKKIGI